MATVVVMVVGAKVPQIWLNWKNQDGELCPRRHTAMTPAPLPLCSSECPRVAYCPRRSHPCARRVAPSGLVPAAGVLSLTTCILNVAGCVVRSYTTVVLTHDVIILGGILVQLVLNGILLWQVRRAAPSCRTMAC